MTIGTVLRQGWAQMSQGGTRRPTLAVQAGASPSSPTRPTAGAAPTTTVGSARRRTGHRDARAARTLQTETATVGSNLRSRRRPLSARISADGDGHCRLGSPQTETATVGSTLRRRRRPLSAAAVACCAETAPSWKTGMGLE